MATLGVDLASQPKKTVAAVIRWGAARATVDLHLRASDATVLALAREAETQPARELREASRRRSKRAA